MITQNVGPLSPGGVQPVTIDIPRGCYLGSGASCWFRITLDGPTPQVAESNEGNNTDSSGCPGVAP